MYARSTTLRGNPEAIDEGIVYVRDEVMPMLFQMDGCVGLSMLCDRESGRCIVTSSWQSQEVMWASADAVRADRARAAEILGDAAPLVDEWDIAAMHRVRETGDESFLGVFGAWRASARVIWTQGQAGQVDRVLDAWRTTVPPQLEQMPGFCGVSVLVNRASARAVWAESYESREAMDRSTERAIALRDRFAGGHGLDIEDVGEFDIALAHLRLPELV